MPLAEGILRFSALQRAEIAEIARRCPRRSPAPRFSALQRAEIAEIHRRSGVGGAAEGVSVLFNEPKLLKSKDATQMMIKLGRFSALQRAEIAEIIVFSMLPQRPARFSALQRAEIAEIQPAALPDFDEREFQCSSTSRNC